MKFPFSLLLAAILLAPLSATAAENAVRKIGCELVQNTYDLCPNGICKAAVLKLNQGNPGCPVKLDSVVRAAPGNSAFDKPISALANTKISLVENLKASLAKLRSESQSGNGTTTLENPNLWKPNPGRAIRKLVAADGTVIDPFAADTAPTSADLDQFYVLEKQRIQDEEQREHALAVERERQRLLAAAAEKEREEQESCEGVAVNDNTSISNMPLHNAAWKNACETAALLIEKGAAMNAKDKYNLTPLHYVALANARATAALLLEKGAAVNAKDKMGRTPLHSSAHKNTRAIAVLLLENGAAVNAKDKDGYTPLHYVAQKNARATAALLLEKGATVNAKSNDGYTPLTLAINSNADEIATLLRQHGGTE